MAKGDMDCALASAAKRKRSDKKPATTTITTILDFPPEILIEIFSRFSIKNVVSCRLVCKTWCTLLSSSNLEFTRVHFARSPVQFILQEPFTLKSRFYIVEVQEDSPGLDRDVELTFPRLGMPNPDFFAVNSCNGLVCLATPVKPYYPIKICNPITGEYLNLPQHRMDYAKDVVVSGLGVSSETNQYKVLRWIGKNRKPSWISPVADKIGERILQIYTIGSESWRTLRIVPNYVAFCPGTYLNGAFHWPCNSSSFYIVSFDLESEKFGTIPMPLPLHGEPNVAELGMKVGVVGNFLYLRANNELWVMKEYGIQESWTKLDVADEFFPRCHPLKYLSGGKILLSCGRSRGMLISYDPVEKISKELKIPRFYLFNTFNYVPSFMSINNAMMGDQVAKLYTKIYQVSS